VVVKHKVMKVTVVLILLSSVLCSVQNSQGSFCRNDPVNNYANDQFVRLKKG
jgi:hypothetical protein